MKTHSDDSKKRVIDIHWFNNLTEILSSYMNVLRYEMRQIKHDQTAEALIHAEVFKILIKEFPPSCISSEYLIGDLFSNGKKEEKNATGEIITKEFSRKFRADIAIFSPLTGIVKRDSKGTAHTDTPIALFEIKRTGTSNDLFDDIYRLAIVSSKFNTKNETENEKSFIGYFLLAAPKSEMRKMLELLEPLHDLKDQGTDPEKIEFSSLEEQLTFYNENDHVGHDHFFANIMYATRGAVEILATISAPSETAEMADLPDTAGMAGERPVKDGGEEVGNKGGGEEEEEDKTFEYIIYGISSTKKILTKRINHRFNFLLQEPQPKKIIEDYFEELST